LGVGAGGGGGTKEEAPPGTKEAATREGVHTAAPTFKAFFSAVVGAAGVVGAAPVGVGGVVWLSAMVVFD
jgi:hypothetical protein